MLCGRACPSGPILNLSRGYAAGVDRIDGGMVGKSQVTLVTSPAKGQLCSVFGTMADMADPDVAEVIGDVLV